MLPKNKMYTKQIWVVPIESLILGERKKKFKKVFTF